MKKAFIVAVGLVASISLTGCEEGHNVPGATIAGTAAGAIIGSQLFHGRGAFAGVAATALVGGLLGNYVGRRMDERDKRNMQSAIVNTPVGSEATWKSKKTGDTYVVRPVKNYRARSGRYCREYNTRVKIGGKWKNAYGRACRQPDGSWQIVK